MKRLALPILSLCLLAGLLLLTQPLWTPNDNQIERPKSTEIDPSLHFVTRDFMALRQSKSLPHYFGKLAKMSIAYHDQDLKSVIPKDVLPFPIDPKERYHLEAEAFSAPEGKKKVVILQINIIESKSGNKVYELARNYEITAPQKPKSKKSK